MSIIPSLVLSQISYGQAYAPYNGSTPDFNSDKFKGNGYYGFSDGLHTVSYELLAFVGTIRFQASLSTDPADTDYFDVDCVITGNNTTPLSGIFYHNFSGNFVWVRAAVRDFHAGAIRKVLYNT
jgi:hypothetical protein